LVLGLATLQILLVSFHGLYLDYSAREIARKVSIQGLSLGDQERLASEALDWMWPGHVVHPSADYLKARAVGLISVSRLSPSDADVSAWTDPRDGRFLPLSPGELDTGPSQDGIGSLTTASTIEIEVVSRHELMIPFVGRLLGAAIARSKGCQALAAIREDCLFLEGRHPLHPGKAILSISRRGRSLLQPAIGSMETGRP
jgi:hypothetical protein